MDDNWLTDWLTDLLIDYKIVITKSVIIPEVSGLYRPTGLLFYLPFSYDPEQFADTHTPILVIGTKVDLAQVVNNSVLKRSASIAEECGADELNLVQLENYVKCSNTCNYISLHNET